MCENNAAGTLWKLGDITTARNMMLKAKQSLQSAYGMHHPVCRGIDWALNAIHNDEPCPL
jgi:hypothetical protein